MDDDQQFCLRWNNHQSTLISVFDTLLENGTKYAAMAIKFEGQDNVTNYYVIPARITGRRQERKPPERDRQCENVEKAKECAIMRS
uniref:Uncharacterized protein n=1 Tax=Phlebotomus papatasi TaxID=29031 RepID=A0A1B0DC68_PHLPP